MRPLLCPPRLILLIALALHQPALLAQCHKPEPPPELDANGDEATFKQDYTETQLFLDKANTYLKCLREPSTPNDQGTGVTENSGANRLEEYNAMIDQIGQVSSRMNAEEKKFKARTAN